MASLVHVDACKTMVAKATVYRLSTKIKENLLAVEESKIALTPDGIPLQVGESTVTATRRMASPSWAVLFSTQLIHSRLSGSILRITLMKGHIQLPSLPAGSVNAGSGVHRCNRHQPSGHYPRSRSTGNPDNCELYRETLALYCGQNPDGTLNMPAGKSLGRVPRPRCWIILERVRKMRGIRRISR